MHIFETKQQLREHFEAQTDPEQGLISVMFSGIIDSVMGTSCLGVRQGIHGLLVIIEDREDFPCEEHRDITLRVTDGLGERMRAFEIELINALVDLAWEINNCTCDHCKKLEAEHAMDEMRRNAHNN